MTRTLFVFLCLAAPCFAAEPPLAAQITIPGRKAPEPPVLANAVSVAPGRFVPLVPPDGIPSYLAQSPAWRVYTVQPGGTFTGVQYDQAGDEPEVYSWPENKGPVYVLLARTMPGTYSLQFVKNGTPAPVVNGAPLTLTIQGPRPPPVPPAPEPPGPAPTPSTGPLRVLIVVDSDPAKFAAYTQGQRAAYSSAKVLNYLNSHCAKDGTTPQWKVVRDNDDLSKLPQEWQNAFAKPRASLPWVSIGNGKTGIECPLPGNTDEMLRLLQTYGGP